MNEEIILDEDYGEAPMIYLDDELIPDQEPDQEPVEEIMLADDPLELINPVRLTSLDALRGFNMFWIIGGAGFILAMFQSLAKWYGWDQSLVDEFAVQITHVSWEGFRFFDLIFPLFIFITGVAVPYSIGSRVDKSGRRIATVAKIQVKIIWRAALLILIGLSFSFFQWVPENVRLYTVLWLIGMSYLIGATLALYVTNWKTRLIIIFTVLVAYHLAIFYLRYPGKGLEMTATNNLAAWVDRNWIPTSLYHGSWDPEGSIRVIPGGMLCLIGAMVGQRLRRFVKPSIKGTGILISGGLACLALGWGWSYLFPFIKSLWSPSFVFWAAGWSMLGLALFYTIMDVWRQVWVGWVFLPIGMNAILIYASQWYLPWEQIRDFFFKGYVNTLADKDVQDIILTGGLVLIQWLILWWLYRKKAFIRI